MHRRSSALSRTTWRTIETTVAAEIRDAKEGRLWLKRRPVASRGSHLTLLCIMAKARCSVPVAAPESSHVLSTMTTEAPVRSGPAQNRAGRHRGSSPRLGVLSTPSRVGQPILNLMWPTVLGIDCHTSMDDNLGALITIPIFWGAPQPHCHGH